MNAREAARYRWDHVAKPLRSLGRLEDMIVQIASLQGTRDVRLDRRCVLVFCADHGVVAEGVSQSGSEVTARVARSIAAGEANVNLMASVARADVFAVDMGMLQSVPGTLNRRVAAGTRNLAIGSAMSRGQALQAMRRGAELVGQMKDEGCQIVAVGEMGIGNTTAAAAVACALLELAPEDCVGRGAGLSDAGLARKREVVRRALEVNAPDPADPVDVLSKVGGFELCGESYPQLGKARATIGNLIEDPGIYANMSAYDNLKAKGKIYGGVEKEKKLTVSPKWTYYFAQAILHPKQNITRIGTFDKAPKPTGNTFNKVKIYKADYIK